MLSFEWPYWELGEEIFACRDCASWRMEVFRRPGDATVWVREWHATDCSIWVLMEAESTYRRDVGSVTPSAWGS